jgi:type I site-specific restriction-modification system R (restriction) subunit
VPPHAERQAAPRDEGDDAQRDFVGFTGTPLLAKDKATSLEVFGGYIHTYKFSEASRTGGAGPRL